MLFRTRLDDTRDWFQVPIICVMNHLRRLKGAYSAIPVVNSILGWISFPSEPITLEISNTDSIQALAIKRDGSAKNRPGHILKQVKKDTNEPTSQTCDQIQMPKGKRVVACIPIWQQTDLD